MKIYNSILAFLDKNNIEYSTLHHEPTPTSQDSARVRGGDISNGGKALVLKVGDEFKIFVIRASLRIDSKKVKKLFKAKKVRFATPEELLELTGLTPGSVPPFGKPILPLDLYIDKDITSNDQIDFNAGSMTDSVIMDMKDYLKISEGEQVEVTKE